jgi:hypothetical protein
MADQRNTRDASAPTWRDFASSQASFFSTLLQQKKK